MSNILSNSSTFSCCEKSALGSFMSWLEGWHTLPNTPRNKFPRTQHLWTMSRKFHHKKLSSSNITLERFSKFIQITTQFLLVLVLFLKFPEFFFFLCQDDCWIFKQTRTNHGEMNLLFRMFEYLSNGAKDSRSCTTGVDWWSAVKIDKSFTHNYYNWVLSFSDVFLNTFKSI